MVTWKTLKLCRHDPGIWRPIHLKGGKPDQFPLGDGLDDPNPMVGANKSRQKQVADPNPMAQIGKVCPQRNIEWFRAQQMHLRKDSNYQSVCCKNWILIVVKGDITQNQAMTMTRDLSNIVK